jgi:hypothetical protein
MSDPEVIREALLLDRGDIAADLREQAIHIKDQLLADLPRLFDSIQAGYHDTDLALHIHDQMVKARFLKTVADQIENNDTKRS